MEVSANIYCYPIDIFLSLKKAVCCIYSNVFQNTITMEAITMNPDQTAPKGLVVIPSIFFVLKMLSAFDIC